MNASATSHQSAAFGAPTRNHGPYSIPCPQCKAAPDVPCTNPKTGRPYRNNAPHIERTRTAKDTQ